MISSMIRSPSAWRVSYWKGMYSALAFFATTSRQICLIFSSSQMGSIPGRVQLNSLSTASMAPQESTASEM